MSFYDWDINPANNTSKPGIDWSEGQLPSTVNGSARQMMADLKAFLTSPQFTGTAQFVNANFSGAVGLANIDISGTLGASLTTGRGVTTGGAAIEIGGARTGDGPSYVDFHGRTGTDYEARVIRGGGASGDFNFHQTGAGLMQFVHEGAGPVVWTLNGGERMRLVSGGSLGLNIAAPAERLDVNGNALVRGNMRVGGGGQGYITADGSWLYARGPGIAFQSYNGGVTFATLDANGNFTTGAAQGHITAGGYLRANNGVVYAGASGSFFMNYNGGNPYINFDSNDYVQLDAAANHFNFVLGGGNQMAVGVSGMFLAGAAGGFKGAGSLNALTLYENNVRVPTITASSLGSTGYRRWSDGLWEMWGVAAVPANTSTFFAFPGGVSLGSWSNVVISGGRPNTGAQDNDPFVLSTALNGFTVFNASDTDCTFWWQGKGV